MSEKSKAKARAPAATESAPGTVQKAQKVSVSMQEAIQAPPNLLANLASVRSNPKMALTQTGGSRLIMNETLRIFVTWTTNFADVTLPEVNNEAKRGVMLGTQPVIELGSLPCADAALLTSRVRSSARAVIQPPGVPYGEVDTTGNNERLFQGMITKGLNAMPGQSKFLFKGSQVAAELHNKMTLTDIHIAKVRGFAYYIGNLKHGEMIIDFLVETWGAPTMIPANFSTNWLASCYPNPEMDPKVFIVPVDQGITTEPEPQLSHGKKTFVLIPDAAHRSLEFLHGLLTKEGFVTTKVTFPNDEPTALWTLVASDHSEVSTRLTNIGITFNIAEMSTPPSGGMGNGSSSIG